MADTPDTNTTTTEPAVEPAAPKPAPSAPKAPKPVPTVPDDSVTKTVEFFQKAFPAPKSKNFHTQVGVHLEEMEEFLRSLTVVGHYKQTDRLLMEARLALVHLSDYLKEHDYVISIRDPHAFLDGLADQIVTSAGVAHMVGMDIAGAYGEVNRSNFTKFGPDGEPIYDENEKMIKGPDYVPPNLERFFKI